MSTRLSSIAQPILKTGLTECLHYLEANPRFGLRNIWDSENAATWSSTSNTDKTSQSCTVSRWKTGGTQLLLTKWCFYFLYSL